MQRRIQNCRQQKDQNNSRTLTVPQTFIYCPSFESAEVPTTMGKAQQELFREAHRTKQNMGMSIMTTTTSNESIQDITKAIESVVKEAKERRNGRLVWLGGWIFRDCSSEFGLVLHSDCCRRKWHFEFDHTFSVHFIHLTQAMQHTSGLSFL